MLWKLMTGDELVVAIGAEAAYELVEALDEMDKTIAHSAGEAGHRCPDPALRKHNLRILSIRLREHRNYAEIGRTAGVSSTRVKQGGASRRPARSEWHRSRRINAGPRCESGHWAYPSDRDHL